jgi:hypothetical protein
MKDLSIRATIHATVAKPIAPDALIPMREPEIGEVDLRAL